MQAKHHLTTGPILVVVPREMRFVISRVPSTRQRVRAQCHHSVSRCERVTVGDNVILERRNWAIHETPPPPARCTRCSPYGRKLAKAILCSLDKTHIIFPGDWVGLCDDVASILVPYATRVGDRHFVCCARCVSGPSLVGTWNGSVIIPLTRPGAS